MKSRKLQKHHPYSTLKAAWHLDRIEKMRKGETIVPVEIQLIISDHCNHDCHWCAYRASNGLSVQNFGELNKKTGEFSHNPKRMMETCKAKEILADAQSLGVKSCIFTGGGEPTVQPDHLDIFDYGLCLGLDCSLNSNGAILRDGWRDVYPRMTYVRFSIDGGDATQYGKDRSISPANYERVLRNLSNVCQEVDKQNSDCVVGVGYVVTKDNYIHVHEGVKRAKEAGAKYIRLASLQSTDGMEAYPGDSWLRANASIAAANESFEDDTFSVISMTDEAMGNVPDYDVCGFQHFVTYIGADLKVYRCCYTAYTDLGEIGSLANQSLSQWIGSEEHAVAMWGFNARECKNCALDNKNRTIVYMIDPNPQHVNFV